MLKKKSPERYSDTALLYFSTRMWVVQKLGRVEDPFSLFYFILSKFKQRLFLFEHLKIPLKNKIDEYLNYRRSFEALHITEILKYL